MMQSGLHDNFILLLDLATWLKNPPGRWKMEANLAALNYAALSLYKS